MGCLGRCTVALARISKEYIACCPAAATRVKHQVLCIDYVFYIRLSSTRWFESSGSIFQKDKSFKKYTISPRITCPNAFQEEFETNT